MLMCPHCGWQYDPAAFSKTGDDGRPFALVPKHGKIIRSPTHMSAAALDSGADSEFIHCPGTEQHPRSPESDRRPLWKDGGVTHSF